MGLFDDEEFRKWIAWENVPAIPGVSWKIDCDGRKMVKEEYAKDTECGWEIDHEIAKGLGGLDVSANLRARHRRGNRQAGGLLGSLLRSV